MDIKKIDTILGVDPGSGGGIAIWREGTIKTVNMPKDIRELNNYFKYVQEISEHPIVFIEHVQMYLGDSRGGKQFGIVKMLQQYERLTSMIKVNRLPLIPVYPQTWQNRLKLKIKGEEKPERKKRYKNIAQLENQHIKVTLKTCDALLILKFARFMLQNEPAWVLERFPKDYELF